MPTQPNPATRPWRCALRFSVRGLIIAVLLIGVWLEWLVHSVRVQREAVAAIRKAGGKAFYDWDWKNGSPVAGGKPCGPRLVLDSIGVDYFGNVVAVLMPSVSERN